MIEGEGCGASFPCISTNIEWNNAISCTTSGYMNDVVHDMTFDFYRRQSVTKRIFRLRKFQASFVRHEEYNSDPQIGPRNQSGGGGMQIGCNMGQDHEVVRRLVIVRDIPPVSFIGTNFSQSIKFGWISNNWRPVMLQPINGWLQEVSFLLPAGGLSCFQMFFSASKASQQLRSRRCSILAMSYPGLVPVHTLASRVQYKGPSFHQTRKR
jgi:hypothetical protein